MSLVVVGLIAGPVGLVRPAVSAARALGDPAPIAPAPVDNTGAVDAAGLVQTPAAGGDAAHGRAETLIRPASR